MKLISVQSKGDRTATIECQTILLPATGEIRTRYYLKKKQIMWKDGFFGPFLKSFSETSRKIAFNLADEWLKEAKA